MDSPISLLLLSIIMFSLPVEGLIVKLPRPSKSNNTNIPAIFIFGDSTVDSGNNNHIFTAVKSNFLPYGKDFMNHTPTGRFTNGRLVTDFIAEYVGLKETVPAYLNPTVSIKELMKGVSFASAGTGLDPLTAKMALVIPVQKQLEYFREYKARIGSEIGEERAQTLITKAAYTISCGTNDFIITYFSTKLRQNYTVLAYQNFLVENLQHLVQGLLQEGARKINVVGLPPMGCLPMMISLHSKTNGAFGDRKCVESLSSVARDYNEAVQKMIKSMQKPNIKLVYGNIYKPLDDMITNPKKYGFSVVNLGCCGSGLYEEGIFCNPLSIVCLDASRNVFWDAVHPTEATYENIFKALRSTIDLMIKD